MGLDMYLSVRKYIQRIDFSQAYNEETGWVDNPEFGSLVESAGLGKFLEPQDSTGAHIEVPVAYWRKANAVHKWFIDTMADGLDDCQPISVHVSQLKELLDLCNQVTADHSRADELLPTEGGLFFGTTDYDEYYFHDLEYTTRRLSELVPMMEGNNDWAVYQASW